MASTGSPRSTGVPPGWPGDDPTVPDDLGRLGGRVRPPRRRPADPPVEAGPDADRLDDPAPDDDDRGPAAPIRLLPRRADRPAPRPAPAPGTDTDGTQPAGRVLVVMVAALLLAMLVNADALVARAELRAPGPGRDRALALWHPVQDVSHVLQLHRVRQLGDRLVGDEGDDDPPAAAAPDRRTTAAAGDGVTTTTAGSEAAGDQAPAGLRTPTADEPLRLWVGGDSMAQVFGPALAEGAEATGVIDPIVHYEMASGLTRADYFNWPGALAGDLAAGDPEIVVFVVGTNDAQGIVLPDGSPAPDLDDPRWVPEYRRRVGAVMDAIRADGRAVLWIGLPPMRDPDFGARMAVVNQAYAAEAATRPWITLVDPATVVGDADGAYADELPDAAGAPVDVRLGDGIHLSAAGSDRLAAHVLDLIRARARITG
jgi:hypothetical protein